MIERTPSLQIVPILPSASTDCHGQTTPTADYTADAEWRAQTDRVRSRFAGDFSRITLLADLPDVARTAAAASTAVVDLNPPSDGCYVPLPIEPGPHMYDWDSTEDRQAAAASQHRVAEPFRSTLALQTDEDFFNARSGFFLVYLNSFNEWHEGHQFEPMKSASVLLDPERARRYHNAVDGEYRLKTLTALLSSIQ